MKGFVSDWKSEKLGQLCIKTTVGFVGSMSKLFTEGGVPLLRGQNIKAGSLDFTNVKFISEQTHEKWKKSSLIENDVVIVRVGYPGTAAVVPKGLGSLNAASLVILRPDSRLLNSKFLMYLLNSPWGKGMVQGRLVGAAQQVFNTKTASELEIPLPPLPIQKRIAGILSAYDDLIAVNTRRIDALEEMARRTYEEWFVHYRFPGGEGTRPDDWKEHPVSSILERLKNGKVYKKKDIIAHGLTPIIDQSRAELLGYHDNAPDHVASSTNPILIFGDHTCKLELMVKSFSLGPNTIAFTGNGSIKVPETFLFFMIKDLVSTQEYKRHWSELTGKETVLPPPGVIEKFTSLIGPSFEFIDNIKKQNSNLRAQRDLLLPRLISGEVDVSDAPLPSAEAAE